MTNILEARGRSRVALVFSLLSLFTAPAAAQPGPAAAVAIPERFPDIDASAVVVREGPKNIILLNGAEVSAETLFIALRVLRRAWSDRPLPAAGEIIPVLAYSVGKTMSPRERRRLEGALVRLRSAEISDLGSWGRGRALPMPGG